MNGIIVGYYKDVDNDKIVFTMFDGETYNDYTEDYNVFDYTNKDLEETYNTDKSFEELKQGYLEDQLLFTIAYEDKIIYNDGYILQEN